MTVIQQSLSPREVARKNHLHMDMIIAENHKIENSLDCRGCSLEVTGGLLDQLPLPVLALGQDNSIKLTNQRALSLLGETDAATCSLEKIFSAEVEQQLLQGLEPPGGQRGFSVKRADRTLLLLTRPLRLQDPYKGLIFIETGEEQ